jgi:hypothetical protein
MLGSITSDQSCDICGSDFLDNGKALVCPNHKNQMATRFRVRIKVKAELVQRRFGSYEEASRFLTGVRYKIDEGSYDARDYKAENPLGFANLALRWLEVKKTQVKRRSWNNP